MSQRDDQRCLPGVCECRNLVAAVRRNDVKKLEELIKVSKFCHYPSHCSLVTENYHEPAIRTMANSVVTRNVNLAEGHVVNSLGQQLLHIAALESDLEIVQCLLENGADPCKQDDDGQTPLHLAVMTNRSIQVVHALMKYNGRCAFSVENKEKNTPLHLAAADPEINLNILKALIDVGSDGTLRNCEGNTPLHLAVKAKHSEAVSELFRKYESSVYVKNLAKMSPLRLAFSMAQWSSDTQADINTINALLDLKPNLNLADDFGKTPLHLVAEGPYIPRLRLRPLRGSLPLRVRDRDGNLPIDIALLNGCKLNVLMTLIALGSPVHFRNSRGKTTLHLAAIGKCHLDVLNWLVQTNEVSVDDTDFHNVTPLHEALRAGCDVSVVRFFREAGSNFQAVDLMNKNCMQFALEGHCKSDVIEELLSYDKALLTNTDSAWNTPLHLAIIYQCSPEVIKTLVDAGANLKAKNKRKQTPLRSAIEYNCYELLYLYQLYDLNERDLLYVDQLSYLHSLVSSPFGHEYVSHFIAKGADVMAKDSTGEIPLHTVSTGNFFSHVKNLLRNQPGSIMVKNNLGQTPLEVAQLRYASEVAFEIIKWGVLQDLIGLQECVSSFQLQNKFVQYMKECIEDVEELKKVQISDDSSLFDLVRDEYLTGSWVVQNPWTHNAEKARLLQSASAALSHVSSKQSYYHNETRAVQQAIIRSHISDCLLFARRNSQSKKITLDPLSSSLILRQLTGSSITSAVLAFSPQLHNVITAANADDHGSCRCRSAIMCRQKLECTYDYSYLPEPEPKKNYIWKRKLKCLFDD